MLHVPFAGDMQLSHPPHACLMGEWAQLPAYVGLPDFLPTTDSHHHLPSTAALVEVVLTQLVQEGCLILFLSFMSCSALKRMSELRQEAASIHMYTKTTAAGGGGKPVEIIGENLWVENMFLDSHRLKG